MTNIDLTGKYLLIFSYDGDAETVTRYRIVGQEGEFHLVTKLGRSEVLKIAKTDGVVVSHL